jgi:GNAT superfamily N-acetyltransferase
VLIPLTVETLLAREQEFRRLTIHRDSDLNKLLTAIRDDAGAFVAAFSYEGPRGAIGWVACELYAGMQLLSVYVDPSWRGQGIGTKLAKAILRRVRGTARADKRTFWRHFPEVLDSFDPLSQTA